MAEKNPLKYEGGQHRPFAPGDTVLPAALSLPTRVLAGDGFTVVDLGNGAVRIDNLCCVETPSVHNGFLTVTPGSGPEGSTFVFTVTLGTPVAGGAVSVQVSFSGTEQTAHGYPSPITIVIPVGALQGSFPLTTINDNVGGPNTVLTGTLVSNPRVTNVGTPASATVVSQGTAAQVQELGDVFSGECFSITGGAGSLSRSVGISVGNDGMAHWDTDAGTDTAPWILGTFNAADYEARITWSATQGAGGSRIYSGSTVNTWINMAGGVFGAWMVNASTATSWTNITARIDIRPVGGSIEGGISMGPVFLYVHSECP